MTNEEQDEVKEIIENTYRALFMKMLNAFALHKIITDDRGVAIDYEFVDVNTSFEEMTGLKKDIIIGKPVTAIIPEIEHEKANWIVRYGKIAQGGGDERFEDYSPGLDKWFQVYAYSPMKGYFATIFNDVTAQKKAEISLKDKIEELEKINKLMIGREMDMIRLKEKIEDIEQKK